MRSSSWLATKKKIDNSICSLRFGGNNGRKSDIFHLKKFSFFPLSLFKWKNLKEERFFKRKLNFIFRGSWIFLFAEPIRRKKEIFKVKLVRFSGKFYCGRIFCFVKNSWEKHLGFWVENNKNNQGVLNEKLGKAWDFSTVFEWNGEKIAFSLSRQQKREIFGRERVLSGNWLLRRQQRDFPHKAVSLNEYVFARALSRKTALSS